MAKQYNLHSVRIEDEVWRRAKASKTSVNQLLRKALDLPWLQTSRVDPVGGTEQRATEARDNAVRITVPPHTGRKPLLKPSEK